MLVLQPQEAAQKLKNIWSPYCKGISLLECPSSQAEKLREEIYSRMAGGESFDAIFTDLNARYDNSLRMSPEGSGRESLAYWLPWIAFAIVISLVTLIWRKKSAPPSPAATQPLSSDLQAKIERDLNDQLKL